MKEIKRDFENQISTNRYVIEVYGRLVFVMEEIKFLLRDARFYLIDLKSKLGYLSLGKISTDVISPISLKTLLLEIQDNTQDLISLRKQTTVRRATPGQCAPQESISLICRVSNQSEMRTSP